MFSVAVTPVTTVTENRRILPLRVAWICGTAVPGTLPNSPKGHGQTIGNSGNQRVIR
jgi:hypothetical protein